MKPVESSEWRFRSPCEIWKRFGFRCVSCRLRYRRVHTAAKR
jgi:hypothetical protein